MRCTTAREQLQRQMTRDERVSIQEFALWMHLVRCPECRDERRHLQQLREAARNLPTPSLPSEMRARVLAEIAAAPILPSANPADAQKWRGNRMVQRTLIVGIGIAATFSMLMLLTPRLRNHGAVLAMGDVRKAVEKVNTWHLKGWKLDGTKEVPWEVWGRRTPFFYHERIGGRETLDDGTTRTIVFPANTAYGNKQPVALTIPSRPDAQSSMGLSFALGLESKTTESRNLPWTQDADTETTTREEMTIGSDPPIQVNGLLTFEKGSPLPIRYERLMRKFHSHKNAEGAFDLHVSNDRDIIKQWTETHLDAQYDLDLDGDALHVATPAHVQQINAVQDAALPTMPTQNAATKNGLTLHVTQSYVEPTGNILLCFEGFVGSVNFKGTHLPFGWDIAVRSGAYQDSRGQIQDTGYPQAIAAHDERGRSYVAVGNLEFLRYIGERNWLALTPLEPLKPGEPLPNQITFLTEMSLSTYQQLPESQSATSVELLKEVLPFTAELPKTHAVLDLPAFSKKYGTPENIEGRGFPLHFEQAAAVVRADAWQDLVRNAIGRAMSYTLVQGRNKPEVHMDPEKKREALDMLRKAVHYSDLAEKAMPRDRQRIASNLDGVKKMFEQTPR